ncbi:alcohol dehydrogenase catalytic domain-containing protein [Mycobacteroides abscessus]|uniref:alcohol dehydrogenase catalytic domain-containing protein n=1 Tax=Mycobacteroides abscessus TaxID=36809 RepID=UPI0005E7D98A|nr:zinc-binding dehydrogenase [Mycobacteroides abscessus]CPR97214.1 oxidoreductase%2C Rxyl_3153 family [Mycobacteroides abscessus]CPS30138.1 oxidoreductase%2C Rxyl_3153 family [Mycobacteroides abscessus]CPS49331.1 oxidoreductase%2C Rxyl_3153 family [Mycobacteroides abscessus]CPT27860.1 oxidoreductase%2C Rxyl_3153 family [Mycobacteroides abscessus]CPT41438.1 oxidoreductase%2C Rxyl_3153 family [Mycobacteroides abscessus]
MKAALLDQVKHPLVIEDVELLPLAPHQVRVRVGASAVSSWDLFTQRGRDRILAPLIAGHEGAGIVSDVGSEVTRVKPGDRVVATLNPACGACWQCVRNRSQLCEHPRGNYVVDPVGKIYGSEIYAAGGLGTMAQVMTLHELQAVPVSTELPDEQLALFGYTVSAGAGAALYAAGIYAGASVVVVGCGAVGIAAIQGAQAAGAETIIAVTDSHAKGHNALAFGATHIVDYDTPNTLNQLRILTEGRGAEFTIEVTGQPAKVLLAQQATSAGGSLILVGPANGIAPLSVQDIQVCGKRVIGAPYGNAQLRRDIPRLARMAEAGILNIENMISGRFALADVNTAVSTLGNSGVIRPVITFP